jgi:hypothetical protein
MFKSMAKWAGRAAAIGVLALGASGCFVDAGTVTAGEPTGTLTTRWSIANSFDAGLCDYYSVDEIELAVYDRGGTTTRAYQPCEDFELTLELPIGSYEADATMIGFDNEAVSTTLALAPFQIIRDRDLLIDTDFPSDAFLY